MSRKPVLLTLCFLVFAALVRYADPLIFSVGLVLLALVVLPTALVCLVAVAYRVRRGMPPKPASTVLLVLVALSLFFGTSLSLNLFVRNKAVEAAKDYVTIIVPSLEAHRKSHGAYPTDLRQLDSTPTPPHLIEEGAYTSDGKTYSFTISVPGGMFDTWDYSSQFGKWILND